MSQTTEIGSKLISYIQFYFINKINEYSSEQMLETMVSFLNIMKSKREIYEEMLDLIY